LHARPCDAVGVLDLKVTKSFMTESLIDAKSSSCCLKAVILRMTASSLSADGRVEWEEKTKHKEKEVTRTHLINQNQAHAGAHPPKQLLSCLSTTNVSSRPTP